MSRYPKTPDEPITDWYAGSVLHAPAGSDIDMVADWEPGDAIVAFSDIGIHGDGTPHAQLVVYVADHSDDAIVGASAELSVEDARDIIRALQAWVNEATEVN